MARGAVQSPMMVLAAAAASQMGSWPPSPISSGILRRVTGMVVPGVSGWPPNVQAAPGTALIEG